MRVVEWTRIARRLAGVSLAGAVAACSALTSLDGLAGGQLSDGGTVLGTEDAPSGTSSGSGGSGGSSGSGSSSGGTPTGDDSGTSDPSSDSGSIATDGSLPVQTGDAATDAAKTPPKDSGVDAGHDAAIPAYCASLNPAPLFCDDFDEGALATPFDQVTALNGKAALDTAFAESLPYSMLSSVAASAPSGSVDVAGYKSFTAKQGVAGTYSFALDMRIDSADTASGSDSVLFALQLYNGSATWDLELEAAYVSATNDFSLSMSEDSTAGYVPHAASTHLPYKTWGRLAFTITLPAGTGGATPATLSLNGTTIASATVHVSTTNPIPEILLGPTYATTTTNGWAIRYDNVTFD